MDPKKPVICYVCRGIIVDPPQTMFPTLAIHKTLAECVESMQTPRREGAAHGS